LAIESVAKRPAKVVLAPWIICLRFMDDFSFLMGDEEWFEFCFFSAFQYIGSANF